MKNLDYENGELPQVKKGNDRNNSSSLSCVIADNQTNNQTETNEILKAKVCNWIIQIRNPETKTKALYNLSQFDLREKITDLAIYLWYSPGIVAILLQDIISTYGMLNSLCFDKKTSNSICRILVLFQTIASHKDTRTQFVKSQIPIFLYPFLATSKKSLEHEYIRVTSLGVIGALAKQTTPDIIEFFLTTEIIPLCLQIMDKGSELAKTVCTFILERILVDDRGLEIFCSTADKFFGISTILYNMTGPGTGQRLMKHILRSYARLAESKRVKNTLKKNLPPIFKDKDFIATLGESKKWLTMLMNNLSQTDSETNDNFNFIQAKNLEATNREIDIRNSINSQSSTSQITSQSIKYSYESDLHFKPDPK